MLTFKSSMKEKNGFALLEVIITLAVLAFATIGISKIGKVVKRRIKAQNIKNTIHADLISGKDKMKIQLDEDNILELTKCDDNVWKVENVPSIQELLESSIPIGDENSSEHLSLIKNEGELKIRILE